MTFHYRYRKQIIIATTIVFCLIIVISGVIYFYKPDEAKTISTIKISKDQKDSKQKETQTEEIKDKYMVDIKGEVVSPGIYELESNSRVIDVIEQAGGLTENADTTVINLSKKIIDEMVIIVYSKSQVQNWIETKEQESLLQEHCITPQDGQVENDACIKEEETESTTSIPEMINLNTATKEELMTLSGIGEAKADAIIAYRSKTPFEKIEDIKNVSGIGDSIYEEIKNYITVQ